MAELSRYLFLLGGLPWIVLGLAHAFMTPLRPADRKALSPRDPAYGPTMTDQTMLLTRRTNLWLAWVGFNLSHSLGVVLFGVAVLLVGRSGAAYRGNASFFLPFAIVVSGLYLAIGLRYWFRTPIIGTIVSGACFVVSGALWVLAG